MFYTWSAKVIPFWHFLEGKGNVMIVRFTGVGYDPPYQSKCSVSRLSRRLPVLALLQALSMASFGGSYVGCVGCASISCAFWRLLGGLI